jgi:protein arginine kinase activator
MCSECAAKHGLLAKNGLPFAMLSNLGEALFSGLQQSSSLHGLICSKCGCTPMSFKETGRLGCPNCYKDLKPLVDGIVESSQKGMTHKGKSIKSQSIVEVEKVRLMDDLDCEVPEKRPRKVTLKERLSRLQDMLDEAIRLERYEDAAKLRDEINCLKISKG